ncbi:ABC transporter permease [Streptomyces sp. KLOTTS4A1]|uniref:ABC transporter permease n=1 Tax=Streptomyces sp. KLOTTS4A1 TaxID=3390996 RepID=UPI0039F5485D
MTTATKAEAPAPATPVAGGNNLAGTRSLIRFILRRDRIRIPVWILALWITTVSTANSFSTLYKTQADIDALKDSMNSPAALSMTGPAHYLTDFNYGSMLSQQMISTMAVMVGLMSVLLITRHTRNEEETGRAELLRSTVVGRHAHLASALTVAVIVNLALGLLIAVTLPALGVDGIDTAGSFLYGLTHTAIGVFFAAVAAVTVQFTAHTRGASGMALTVIGSAFALRAAGDAGGNDVLSWLSPIGWVQRTYPYVDNLWWPLLLTFAAAGALAWTGFRLSTRRDVGAGLRAARLGPATASDRLTTPLGFALRLHRGLLIGFLCGMLLFGAMYGSLLGDAEGMLGNVEEIKEALDRIGGASLAESFASMVLVILAIVSSVFVVMAALKPRAEENAGRAEPLLATGLSRTRWVGSHLVSALSGGTLVLLMAGLGLGLAGAGSTGDGAMALDLTGAALAYAPAMWVTAGVGVLLFGWFPRATSAVWIVPVYAFVVGYLGQILQFPAWLNNLSPFGHVPRMPAADMDWLPLITLTAVAAALMWAGLAGFRRRDLETK